MQVRYYYYRDAQRRPLVTLCSVQLTTGRVGYGWAVCSTQDRPHRFDEWDYDDAGRWHVMSRGGCDIARGRAVAALAGGTRGVQIADGVWRYARPICREDATTVVLRCGAEGVVHLSLGGSAEALPVSMQPPPPRKPEEIVWWD